MPGNSYLMNNNDNSSTSYYNTLMLLGGLSLAVSLIAMSAKYSKQLKYDSPVARLIAGFLIFIVNTLHTTTRDLKIMEPKGQIVAIGPHRTGLLDAAVISSKITGVPLSFWATDAFNWIPGVAYLLSMFHVIPVAAKPTKNSDGTSSNSSVVDLGEKVLSEGGNVAMFPQGNFAKRGQDPHPIYSGTARLALKSKKPILVIRLDGFGLENSKLPNWILNNPLYRAVFSLFAIRNITATECCTIDFHLKPENAGLTDDQKINEINAQMYAFYRNSEDISGEQIQTIKQEISEKKHLLIWEDKKQIEITKKASVTSKKEEAQLNETMPMNVGPRG